MSINRSFMQQTVLIMFLAVLIGIGASYAPIGMLLIIGILLYFLLVLLITNEILFKRILIPSFLLIIFQDMISGLFSKIHPIFGQFFTYTDELFLVVTIPALLIQFCRGKKIIGTSIILSLIIILIFGFFSSVVNDVSLVITLQGAFLLTKGLLYAFIFVNISFTEQDIQKYIHVFKYISIFVLVFAFIDLLIPTLWREFVNINSDVDYRFGSLPSVQSIFNNPSVYGWFMIFAGMFALSKYKIIGENKYLIFSLLFFAVSLLSFRFKTTMSIFVILLIFYLLFGSRKVLAYILPIAIIGSVFFLFTGDYILNFINFTIERYLSGDWNDTARTALYYVSVLVANDNFPFGAGFGQYGGFIAAEEYSPVYYQYGLNNIYGLFPEDPKYATDTYWPNILGEIGYLATIALALFFIILIFKLLKSYKLIKNATMQIIVLFSAFVIIQALIESIASPVFNSPPRNVIIFALLGVALSLINQNKKESNIEVK